MFCNSNQQIFIMETTEIKQSEFKQAYFQASVVLNSSVISTVLVRDFLTANYYLGVLKRLHADDLRYYCITTYMLTSQQCKEINSDPKYLGYNYFSSLK